MDFKQADGEVAGGGRSSEEPGQPVRTPSGGRREYFFSRFWSRTAVSRRSSSPESAFNLLLQILHEGRLTDSQGRTVDFRNTVLIMTSNLGSSEILAFEGKRMAMASTIRNEAEGARAAEAVLPSRVPQPGGRDRGVPRPRSGPARPDRRHSLRSPETAAYRRVELEVTEAVKRFLAEAGYDPVYGTRPIKRSVQRGLETEIARRLVLGEIEEGRKLTVDLSDGELRFLTARPEMVVAS